MRHELDRVPRCRALPALAMALLIVAPWSPVAGEPQPGPARPVVEATPAAGGPAVPSAPQEPLAAKVYGILDMHCASCHQPGRGDAARTLAQPSDLLDLDRLARNRSLVEPGYPDASGIYLELLRRHRPADFFRDGTRWKGPTAAEIDAVRSWIEALPAAQDGAAEPITARASAGPEIQINLRADRRVYKAGDLLTLSVQTDRDCYLTLISVDAGGRAIVLFPNDLEPDNKLVAGAMRRIPGDSAAYQLRLDTRGREIVSATCTTAAQPPLRIEHEFGRRRFTILGDWRKFLTTALEQEALGTPQRRKVERRRARRRGEPRNPPAETQPSPALLQLEARSAIIVKVE